MTRAQPSHEWSKDSLSGESSTLLASLSLPIHRTTFQARARLGSYRRNPWSCCPFQEDFLRRLCCFLNHSKRASKTGLSARALSVIAYFTQEISQMNTVTSVHPRLQHIGMTTPNIDAMVKWYRTAMGMDLVHRTGSAANTGKDAPVLKAAWVTNNEPSSSLCRVARPDCRSREESPSEASALRL